MAVKQRKGFTDSPEGKAAAESLRKMMADASYNTAPSYSANSTDYPDNLMPFADKHMKYLNEHPQLEVGQYIANIKLMSRIR